MALSKELRERLVVALTDRPLAKQLADAIDAAGNAQAANVADISLAAVGTTDGTGSDAALAADVDSRLQDIETKINDILEALQDAGLMST